MPPIRRDRVRKVKYTLIYSMGDEANDILSSFKLFAYDLKKYETVKKKVDDYFVQRRNVNFERAKFNQRLQCTMRWSATG